MTREEMKAELLRLKQVHDEAFRIESDTRTAKWHFAKQIEKELIAEGGWKIGEEIKTKSGEKCWIGWMSFNEYNGQLTASCYRVLKSGKKSQRPDLSVVLADLSMDKEKVE